jgi:hypothetical protein
MEPIGLEGRRDDRSHDDTGRTEEATMAGKRFAGTIAAITIPLALAVQSVLAIGDAAPSAATPEAPSRGGSIDPGFIVRVDGDVDSGFVVAWEDRSNDTGFIVGPGQLDAVPAPSPTPVPGTPPATTLDARS